MQLAELSRDGVGQRVGVFLNEGMVTRRPNSPVVGIDMLGIGLAKHDARRAFLLVQRSSDQ